MNRDELKQLFLLLEELNDFFHQPMNLEDSERVRAFAERVYPEIRTMYYETVWNALPEDMQTDFENR